MKSMRLMKKIRTTLISRKLLENQFNSFYRYIVNPCSTTVKADLRSVMVKVPQPVFVITSAMTTQNGVLQRGMTCSTFTNVSNNPPLISACIQLPSEMFTIIKKRKIFVVNLLSNEQSHYARHFATSFKSDPSDSLASQFNNVEHVLVEKNIPLIKNTAASIICHKTNFDFSVGDHSVIYGKVVKTNVNSTGVQPLLYYYRSFHSLGDEMFMEAFENTSLPFVEWTHIAHVRMAWNYILLHGKEKASSIIKQGIKKYNERNKHLLTHGYNETITSFYIHMIDYAIKTLLKCKTDKPVEKKTNFDYFIETQSYLTSSRLPFSYYSRERITSNIAKSKFLLPDLKPLPQASDDV